MSIERIKRDCRYLDTGICKYAGSEGCENCIINHSGEKESEEIARGWEVTQSYLPDNIDELHNSPTCQFCKNDEAKDAYVLVEMAHHEPEFMSRKFFGLGPEVRAKVGSLLQIPVPICKECKKKINKANNVKWLATAIGVALIIIVLSFIPAISSPDFEQWYIPAMTLIAGGLAGYSVGVMLEKNIREQIAKEMITDAADIPLIKEMIDKGWYKFTNTKNTNVFIISKNKPRPNVIYKA